MNGDFLYTYGFLLENNKNGLAEPGVFVRFKKNDPLLQEKKSVTNNKVWKDSEVNANFDSFIMHNLLSFLRISEYDVVDDKQTLLNVKELY